MQCAFVHTALAMEVNLHPVSCCAFPDSGETCMPGHCLLTCQDFQAIACQWMLHLSDGHLHALPFSVTSNLALWVDPSCRGLRHDLLEAAYSLENSKHACCAPPADGCGAVLSELQHGRVQALDQAQVTFSTGNPRRSSHGCSRACCRSRRQ